MSEGGGEGLDALIVRDASREDLGFMQRMLYEAVNRPGTTGRHSRTAWKNHGTGAIGSDG